VIESPQKVHEMWLLEAEAHHAENGCFVLTNAAKGIEDVRTIRRVEAPAGYFESSAKGLFAAAQS